MAVMNPVRDEEEDGWFGEGSAFDSGEDLAAALMELAGTPVTTPVPTAPRVSEFEERMRSRDMIFELLRPFEVERETDVVATARAHTWASVNQPMTWSVRAPGSVSLPARQPGKTGWSIRSSVQVLRRTEEVLLKLREEAVDRALTAAARAVRTAR